MNVAKEGFPHHQGIPNITHSSQLNPNMLRKSDIRTSSFLFLKILLPPKSREEPTT